MKPAIEDQVGRKTWRYSKAQASTALIVGLTLLIAAALRFWRLADHGFDNLYYSPAAFSMSLNWHNFWFAAFDPAGFLAIGKPPGAFWMQALSIRIFGFNGFAIHLPQAFAGVLSVLLVFLLARRVASVSGAAFAALIAAVTPASDTADRSNLADSWLLLALLGAAILILSASETGSLRRLVLGSTLVGLGFLTKFMAAFVALPALFLTYGLTAPIAFRRRLAHLGVAAVVVAVTSLIWPAAVDLTPSDRRPYIAETSDNSVLSLAFGVQGLGRIFNRAAPPIGSGRPPSGFQPGDQAPLPERAGPVRGLGPAGPPPRSAIPFSPRGRRLPPLVITGQGGAPGLLRLANRDMAGHITWFFPILLVGAITVVSRKRLERTRRQPHRDTLLWVVWFLTFAAVFSLPPTFIHPYYLTLLAPAVAILAAVTVANLWAMLECGDRRSALLAISAVVLTLLWHLRILSFYPPWAGWLVPVLSLAGLASGLGILVARTSRIRRSALVLAGVAAFVSPLLWAATPALAPVGRMIPIADPTLLDYRETTAAEGARPTHLPTLVRFLQANHSGERFILAVRDIHWAAPVILETGEAVMAFGPYDRREEALSTHEFARMVSSGEVRFVLIAPETMGDFSGPSRRSAARNGIEEWVRNNGTLVPPKLWQSPKVRTARASVSMPMWGPTDQMVSMMYGGSALELYDCRAAHE